ncbi:MAG: transglycosylase SLT domain-containing protein [Gammaproteobacteria bacterium]
MHTQSDTDDRRNGTPQKAHSLKQVGNITLLLIAAGWLVSSPAAAAYSREEFSQQRQQFIAAEDAAQKQQWSRYQALANQLRDYPLYPYLEYQRLSKHLAQTDDGTIQKFITEHADTPIAQRLHTEWLYSLARRSQWQTLVDHFAHSNNTALQCIYINALLNLNQQDRAFSLLESTWLTGQSLPRSCDQPIAVWQQHQGLTPERVWQRIRLSMQAGRSSLARYLARTYLPESERYWVGIWSKVRRQPEYVHAIHERFSQSTETRPTALRWLLIDGLRRMAYREPVQAAALWQHMRTEYPFTTAETQRLERRLAAKLAEHNSDEARHWLAQLNLSTDDSDMLEIFALSALRDQDWPAALQWLNRIQTTDSNIDRWNYWRARALEAMGRLDESRQLYIQNTDVRSYYSFLAADRAGQPYRFANRPLQIQTSQLAAAKNSPAVVRAAELYWLNRIVEARREWHYALQHMDQQELLQAAQLAHHWGWHDRSIVTLSQASYWDDLEKRFPLAHRELVEKYAGKNQINPAWAYAIIRQESAFIADAKSHAGALGLMQLLPGTARQMARSLQLRRPKQNEILHAGTNIRLGIGYLNKVQKRFQGNAVLATAAYNAGGSRVKSWLPEEGSIPADVWVELVPFHETRDYLQRVMTYTVIYEQRLGMNPQSLLERMPPIHGPVTIISKDAESAEEPESRT